jgi:DNA helicase-2/ATP-dependent DNA helicase PcrA
MHIPLTQVTAAFYYVRTGDIIRPQNLPTKQELTQLLDG